MNFAPSGQGAEIIWHRQKVQKKPSSIIHVNPQVCSYLLVASIFVSLTVPLIFLMMLGQAYASSHQPPRPQEILPFWKILLAGAGGGIVGAVLTVFGQYLIKKREVGDIHRNIVSQKMIEAIDRDVRLIYGAVVKAAGLASSRIKEYLSENDPHRKADKVETTLYHLMRLIKRFEVMDKEADLIYLSTTMAEIAVRALETPVIHKLREIFGNKEYGFIESTIAADCSFSEFQELYSGSLSSARELFLKWIENFGSEAAILAQNLRFYSELFVYEINLVYGPWYGPGSFNKPILLLEKSELEGEMGLWCVLQGKLRQDPSIPLHRIQPYIEGLKKASLEPLRPT